MGRPNVGKASIISQEGKISNPAAPATCEKNSHSHANNNSTNKEATNVETIVDPKSNGSPTKKKTSQDSSTLARRSDRLKRKGETFVPFNLVECKRNKSPAPDEKIVEQEAPPLHNSTNMETTEGTVRLDSNGSSPRKKTSEVTIQAGRNKRNKEPVVRLNLVGQKKKASKGKQVSTLPIPTEKNSEKEAPFQVHQAVDERDLVEKVDYIVQENTSPNDSPPTDADYRGLYLASERRVEELMVENIDIVKELNFALGKVEAYEKMMGAMGFTLHLSTQRGIPPPTNAAVPDTSSNHHQKVSSPKVKKNKNAIPDANDKASSPKRSGKYKKKAKA